MFLAIAVLLIQPQVVPQLSFSAEKIPHIQPSSLATNFSTDALTMSSGSTGEDSLTTAPVESNDLVQPAAASDAAVLPDAPVPTPALSAPVKAAFIKPKNRLTVTVGELLAENRRNQFIWRGLTIATSGAATFDAWTTRRAITQSGAQELNPMLRPFAGNASLYAAIQVGPALMDLAGKKMMYSRHSWVRRMWWVPQSASFVSSIFCGAHNLSYR
jgi:hypothetical protein